MVEIELKLMINSDLFIGSIIVTTSKPVLTHDTEIGAKWSVRLYWLHYCAMA